MNRYILPAVLAAVLAIGAYFALIRWYLPRIRARSETALRLQLGKPPRCPASAFRLRGCPSKRDASRAGNSRWVGGAPSSQSVSRARARAGPALAGERGAGATDISSA